MRLVLFDTVTPLLLVVLVLAELDVELDCSSALELADAAAGESDRTAFRMRSSSRSGESGSPISFVRFVDKPG